MLRARLQVSLTTAILARNEAAPDRYLKRVIERCRTFSDTVLLLDDRSTDDTPKIAKDLRCEVKTRSILKDAAWGHEAPARAELWNWAAEVAGDGWVLICDADQTLEGDPRPYLDTWESNTICFPLYDLWDGDTTYRADGYWQGYTAYRPWLFAPARVPKGWSPAWPERGLHSGHAPANWPMICPIAAEGLHWLHWAYRTPEQRQKKAAQYLSNEAHLTPPEAAHARSIADV